MPPKHGHQEHEGREGGGRGDRNDDKGDRHDNRGGRDDERGDRHDDKGADTLIGGRGGHQGGEGRGGRQGGGGGGGRDEHMSPELRQAVENAKQDRVELANAAPENKAQCAEACKNSEAEVVRLGGSPSMIGGPDHPGGPGERDDKGADELIGGRGGHQGGRGGRGGRGGHRD